MDYLIQNEKNFFLQTFEHLVLTVSAFEACQAWINGKKSPISLPIPTGKHLEEWKVFLSWVQKLPVRSVFHYNQKSIDSASQNKKDKYYVWAYAFKAPQLGAGNAQKVRVPIDDFEAYQHELEHVFSYKPSQKIFNTLKELDIHSELRQAQTFKNQVEKWKKIQYTSSDLAQELFQAKPFAVYVNQTRGQGYFDHQGRVTNSLGAARLFESAEAAERVIKSKYYNSYEIVEVHMQLHASAKQSAAYVQKTDMSDAMALRQKHHLQTLQTHIEHEFNQEQLERIRQEHPEWFKQNSVMPKPTSKKRL